MQKHTVLVTLVAAFSCVAVAVGCSTPAIGSVSDNGGDTDEATSGSTGTTTSTTTTTTVVDSGTTTTTTTSPITGVSACFSSCIATTPAAAQYITCRESCADQTCDTNCFNTACGAQSATCNTALTNCQTQCPVAVDAGTTTTPGSGNTCVDQCINATNAAPYWQCTNTTCAANDRNCDDNCFFSSPCGQNSFTMNACDNILDGCFAQCGQ